jgi:hypothetical protein
MELEAEVAKLKEENEELQKKQVFMAIPYFTYRRRLSFLHEFVA